MKATGARETGPFSCPPDHKHGATSNCYTSHSCRCADCKRTNAHRAARRRRLVAYGTHRTMIPTVGVRRRLQALAYAGWSIALLSERSGLGRNAVHSMMSKKSTVPRVYDRAVALYDELWDKEPPQSTPHEKASVARTKGWARRNGWVPALAWDDDSIDDPAAVPDTGHVSRRGFMSRHDPEAVSDALDGIPTDLSPLERREVVTVLNARRWAAHRIAQYAGCDVKTVERIREELGLPVPTHNQIRDAA